MNFISVWVAVIAVLVSAFVLIYIKDINRQLNNELQVLQTEQNKLHVEWGQLLLEQSTLARQPRILSIAKEELNMLIPTAQRIKVVKV